MSVHKDNALFAECKWKNADTDVDVFYDLKRKSELFGYKKAYLYIFTKSSITSRLMEESKKGNVKIITIPVLTKTP